MDLGFKDRNVLITGASGSIGRSLCETFAAEGASLILHGHSRFADLEAWVASRPWRQQVRLFAADLSKGGALDAALDAVLVPEERLDVAVANAGHWPKPARALHEIDDDRWRATLDANLMTSVRTAASIMKRLERLGPDPKERGASLVFVGSTAGRFGERDHADYAAAKAALVGLAKTLKNEVTRLDPYARVNVVEPGWTRGGLGRSELDSPGVATRIARTMALRQLARGEDIARVVLGLSSAVLSRHVSGEVIAVHGGMEGRQLWNDDEIDEAAIRRRLDSNA
ncbi:MAG: SDR family oxidoreductase [Planctomycetes bacterium]|nr:SDR family oxidoreductase [Planctomycetota bacterium]